MREKPLDHVMKGQHWLRYFNALCISKHEPWLRREMTGTEFLDTIDAMPMVETKT